MMTKKRTKDELYWAAYVALPRLGRPDLVDPDVDAKSRARAENWFHVPKPNDTDIPPTACMTEKTWAYWPDANRDGAPPHTDP